MNDAGIQKHEIDCELTRVRKEQIQWKKMAEKVSFKIITVYFRCH